LRTLAALLAFFATFIIAWAALARLSLAFVDWAGFEDEAMLGLAFFAAPVMAYFAAIFCGIFVITPRPQAGAGR
jgi:hypothetical protein